MQINLFTDTFDNSNWLIADFNGDLDHDAITELQSIRYKHNLRGGQSTPSSYKYDGFGLDSSTVYIENPTPQAEKEVFLWRLKHGS